MGGFMNDCPNCGAVTPNAIGEIAASGDSDDD